MSPGFEQRGLDDSEDIALLHHQQLLAIDGDLMPGALAKNDALARSQGGSAENAVFVPSTGSNSDHLALFWFSFGDVRENYSGCRLLAGFERPYGDEIAERAK